MSYYITDGKYYIYKDLQNKFSLTTDHKKALKWEKQEKAVNFLNAFPKGIKRQAEDFHPELIDSDESPITKIELNFEIDSFIEEMMEKTNNLKNRHAYLITELSRLDKERVDIEHAAEFYELNAAQGYKLYKRLHDNAVERRKVKDEIYKISMILSNQMNITGISNVKKCIESLEKRSYSPRVLDELFEN